MIKSIGNKPLNQHQIACTYHFIQDLKALK